MYEGMTYEYILNDMLSRVPSSMDKREGSIIYDALAPAAAELAITYIALDNILKETFADTATREYLIRRAAERGITPTSATYAVLKGVFTPSDLTIPTGSRFSCGTLNYEVTESIADGEYKLQCETAGEEGNTQFGQMIPIDYISGLETCYLAELLIPGEDEESTEGLRIRYFDSFETSAYGGNRKDYIEKTNAIDGVGSTKVTPVWNGGGTVLLTILDSTYNAASSTLIETVQQKMDPDPQGEGYGIAPIDHIVTVQTAEEVTVNVTTSMAFDEGYSFENLKTKITTAISDYLAEIRKEWADVTVSIVRVSQIETRLLAITGVLDVTGTALNGKEENLTLSKYEIPVMGEVTNV